ncbi:MAG: hypothetical protein J7641_18665 [Cyanobacteria bacterium SID2]|nr:hypothetical protein [Cyanobacteria bacterium SID2]MBP0005295.1 hypothetical protein [Cyanobacteria bacterium SBC]
MKADTFVLGISVVMATMGSFLVRVESMAGELLMTKALQNNLKIHSERVSCDRVTLENGYLQRQCQRGDATEFSHVFTTGSTDLNP